ncbi:DNA ligase [Actinotalea sp.]|uniref:ATP-dependent DNA ligase n=1 Tax=Actinotalea sp. TaxID=1872145 RepID=UPI0035626122
MLATRAADPASLPRGPEWSYELKWDGVRAIADTDGGRLRLSARSGRDITVAYPELAGLGELQGAVIDGEIVVMAGGVPSFEAIAERMHVRDPSRAAQLARRSPVTFVAFDVLRLYGVDMTGWPLDKRRAVLDRVELPDRVIASPIYPDVDELWQVTLEHGLEGVVAKRRGSTYQPGRRSQDWVKAAHRSSRVAAVVGWRAEGAGAPGPGGSIATRATPSATASSQALGAVLLAAPDADGTWRYLGRAGSGLAGRPGAAVARALAAVAPGPRPDGIPDTDARGTVWCRPEVAVDVAYLHRTRSGRLRQPVVRGLREDVPVDPWEEP